MKFKIKGLDNKIDIDGIAFKVKNLLAPAMNKFKELNYRFINAQIREEAQNNFDVISVVLSNRESRIKLVVYYKKEKDAIGNYHAVKYKNVDAYTYEPFTKEELKILDIYNFDLTPTFKYDFKQDTSDWVDIE